MKAILITIALMATLPASATQNFVTAEVRRTLVDENNFGGCMANLGRFLESTDLTCRDVWVSFSCSGDFNSSSFGFKKFQAAQLALITGKRIRVKLNDAKTHNGYCYAERIDSYND
jgi:hypothetical protein